MRVQAGWVGGSGEGMESEAACRDGKTGSGVGEAAGGSVEGTESEASDRTLPWGVVKRVAARGVAHQLSLTYIVTCHLPAARWVVTSACRIRQSPLTWAMTSPHSRCHFLL